MYPSDGLHLAIFCYVSLPLGFVLGWLVCLNFSSRIAGNSYSAVEKQTSRAAVAPDILLLHAETAFRSFSAVTEDLQHDVGLHGERISRATTLLAASSQNIAAAVSCIAEANAWLQGQLVSAQSTIRQQAIELERWMLEANSDGLTSIGNRRAFDLELERHLSRWHRYGSRFASILFDIDHFKEINDRHGHMAGDAVLQTTAELIKGNLREVDFTARYGGDEFAAILPETDHQNAMDVADRIRKIIAATQIPWEGKDLTITVSVGVAGLSRLDDTAALIKRADEALYISKRSGRNRTTLATYTPTSEEVAIVGGDGDVCPLDV
jgi:diguanylate cyclase (GGDEF)-like protein